MTTPAPKPIPRWISRILRSPWAHALLGLGVLIVDLLTGPFMLFPILFVLPVSLSAWFDTIRRAYALAVFLPLGRFAIAVFVDAPAPLVYMIANAIIRVAVLLFMAFLVGRTARQTKLLHERISGFVRMCAWSRTVEYQGEWISFEEYLKKRFNLDTSHGISPAQAQKAFGELKPSIPLSSPNAATPGQSQDRNPVPELRAEPANEPGEHTPRTGA